MGRSLGPLLRTLVGRSSQPPNTTTSRRVGSATSKGWPSGLARKLSTGSREDILQKLRNYELTGIPKDAGRLGTFGFDLGKMHRLLEALGSPHLSFPVVQVAGTKGKGSTSMMLSNILRASGYNVGTYTSPHVVHESERIMCGSSPSSISVDELRQLQERTSGVVAKSLDLEGGNLSYFEVFTALAFKHFKDRQVDVAVVEAGLGGETDATNVFPASGQLMSIITAVGMDHKDALGETVQEIARTKAGILRAGRPVVLAHQPQAEAGVAVRDAAAEKRFLLLQQGCPVLDVARDVALMPGGISNAGGDHLMQLFSAEPLQPCDGSFGVGGARLRLLGAHQLLNAAAAVRASWELAARGWRVSADSVREGLAMTTLPGRFEVLRSAQGGGPAQTLVLDGAHTPESAEALVVALREAMPGRPLVIVVAMLNDKDIRGFMRALKAAGPRVVIFTSGEGSSQRQANSGTLTAAWQLAVMQDKNPLTRRVRSRELVMASMEAAMAKAVDEARAQEGGESVVCVTGSFTAVSAAMRTTTYQHHFRHSLFS